jgi:hypothetical protein
VPLIIVQAVVKISTEISGLDNLNVNVYISYLQLAFKINNLTCNCKRGAKENGQH